MFTSRRNYADYLHTYSFSYNFQGNDAQIIFTQGLTNTDLVSQAFHLQRQLNACNYVLTDKDVAGKVNADELINAVASAQL